MIAGLQDGDIIDIEEVEKIVAVTDSLRWIVQFCYEHPDWFGIGEDSAECEWLTNAGKLLEDE